MLGSFSAPCPSDRAPRPCPVSVSSALLRRYDEPEILSYPISSICPKGADGGQEPLGDDARSRVFDYIAARLEIASPVPQRSFAEGPAGDGEVDEDAIVAQELGAPKYGSLAELHDAAQPKSNADRALVAGYWLQVCQGSDSFDGYSANKELKNLGHGVSNITNAIDSLKGQKPASVLQLKKSGKSQQARKVYKVTVAGIKVVEAMISG